MKAIAAVDIMDGKVVRLLRGNPKESTVYGDDPVAMAKRWAKEGAHMLHIVDLDATLGLGSNLNVIREIALAVDVPVQIAGGLRNAEIIDNTAACANSLVIGTLAFKDKPVLREAYAKYGADRLVISVDHRDGIIVVNGWQSSTGIKLLNGVEEFMQMGFTIFRTRSFSVSLPCSEAVISKKTSSSAPSSLYFFASSTGSPASRNDSKFSPFTTRPSETSRHGMILFVSILLEPLLW